MVIDPATLAGFFRQPADAGDPDDPSPAERAPAQPGRPRASATAASTVGYLNS
jgi:hypothetical protein